MTRLLTRVDVISVILACSAGWIHREREKNSVEGYAVKQRHPALPPGT
jgi:hypothetical protein